MLTDALWNFTGVSPGQAVTVTAASTNHVDLLALGAIPPNNATARRDLGKGQKIPLLVQVTETFLTCTSVKVALQSDSDPGFATALTTILETEAIAVATLLAGYKFNLDIIPTLTVQRYLRLYFTVAGSNATAGKIFACATMGNQDSF
jgi:hypothetical protein